MICFYHGSDLDGHCSGAIIKHKYKYVTMVPVTYGRKIPTELALDDVVYMVDFSLEPFQRMIGLREKSSELIWIDHHSSSIELSEKFDFNPPGIRRNDVAACELVWEWCFPDIPIPKAVKLISMYDVWNHNTSKDVVPFQLGLRAKYTLPDSRIWEVLFENYLDIVDEIISAGKYIQEYINADNERFMNAFSFETIFEGYNCICCNRGMVDSRIFDSKWDPKRHDLMVMFCRANNKWAVHLYTSHEGIDCGKIAKKYGGGGHKIAAAFRAKDLPFKI